MWRNLCVPLSLLFLFAFPAVVASQTNPNATQVTNQAKKAFVMTPGQTLPASTSAIYIADAAPCSINAVFALEQAAVRLDYLNPGAVYPFQIRRIETTDTTCQRVIALW